MKAIRIHGYGGPEVLRLEDIPQPSPGPRELLIKIHAASVNPVDWNVRQGHMQQFLPLKLPAVLGWDLSGVIEAVGTGVGKFKVGDEVYAGLPLAPDRNGTYAEYTITTEAETAAKPRTLDHVQAATVGVAGLTAWRALFETAQLAAGQKVLIHRAAGGVGTFAVQFAHWKGAHVLGTASSKTRSSCGSLGSTSPSTTQRLASRTSLRTWTLCWTPRAARSRSVHGKCCARAGSSSLWSRRRRRIKRPAMECAPPCTTTRPVRRP